MIRVSRVLAVMLILLIAFCANAKMTQEKAEHYQNLEAALSALHNGQPLTNSQNALLEKFGGFYHPNFELDQFGGPDDFGYSFIDNEEEGGPVYNWIDISETGTSITGWSDDVVLGPFEVGFDFPFYGENQSMVYLCSNGWMSFVEPDDYYYWWDNPLPNPEGPNNAIYWQWQDLFPDSWEFEDIAYYGDDGNGNTVFQFDFVNGDNTEVEVVLSPDGTILIQYGPNHSREIGREGTRVGLENGAGDIALVVSDAQIPAGYPYTGLAILFEMLDMGTVDGVVTDAETNDPIVDATVTLLQDGVPSRSTTTDEEGHYAMMVEVGDYSVFAEALGYIDSEPVDVTVNLDETVTQNIALTQGDVPVITLSDENIVINCPWMGTADATVTLGNDGGLDMPWESSIEYVEEELALLNAGRTARRGTLPQPNPVDITGETTPGVHFNPDIIPATELDEGPYLIMFSTPVDNSILEAFNNNDIEYTFTASDNFANVDLTEYGTLICGNDGGNVTDADCQAAIDFMEQGGTVWYFGGTTTWSNALANRGVIGNAGTGWQTSPQPNFILTDPAHPLAVDLPEEYTFINNSASYSYIRYDENDEGVEIAAFNGNGFPILLNKEFGDGMFIAFANSPYSDYWTNQADQDILDQIIANMADFTAGWLTVEPNAGEVAPAATDELLLLVDAAAQELLPGTYEASVTITTIYPNVDPGVFWVTLNVEEPGSVAGTVTDCVTELPMEGAEVFAFNENGEEAGYALTDADGAYAILLGTGTFNVYANAQWYYPSEPAQITVEENVQADLDICLNQEIAAVIDPSDFPGGGEQGLVFDINWGFTETQTYALGNSGGLGLNFETYIEYIEDEEVLGLRDRIRDYRHNFVPAPALTINNGPSSDDQGAFPVVRTTARYSELDDPYFILFQDQQPWNNSHQEFLAEMDIPFDVVGSNMMGVQDLSDYTVIMIPSTQGQMYYDTFMANAEWFAEYVDAGGWLEFHGCTQGATWTLWDGTSYVHQDDRNNLVVAPDHPIVQDIPETFTGSAANHGWLNNVPEDAEIIITDSQGRPVLFEKAEGRGNMIVTSETWEYGVGAGEVAGDVMHNAILYSAAGARGAGGWLTIEPAEGTIVPDDAMDINFTVDVVPDQLLEGVYEARVEFYDDDERVTPFEVWVTLNVTGNPPLHHYLPMLNTNYFELISTYLDPSRFDPNIATVMSEIDVVIAQMSNGNSYIPGLDVNTIGDMDVRQAYRVFTQTPEQELHIAGDPLDENTEYIVQANRWNWVGYPFDFEMPADAALASITDHLVIIMNDEGHIWIPGLINTLGMMTPGEGYYLIVNEDLTFTYDLPVALATTSEVWDIPEVEDGPVATGLPYTVLVSLDETVRNQQPATIEIYDGNLLVGKSIVLDRDITPVTTWQGSPDHSVVGYAPGNEMRIVVTTIGGTIIAADVDNTPIFGEGAYASVTLSTDAMPTEFAVSQGYPNPFNPSVTVPFAMPATGDVNFKVFNVLGQQVYNTTQRFEAGHHRFMFNANVNGSELVSGVYFLQVQFKGQVKTQKLMLLK